MKVGVLALQGAFQLHQPHIEALGAKYVEVVKPRDFGGIDGIILPGGESSVMLQLITAVGCQSSLQEYLKSKPAWGVCAGAILMAKTVKNPIQFSFGALDIEVERNGYGRQLDSTHEEIDGYKVAYIRAPKISRVDPRLQVLSRRAGLATWVESGTSMVTTFHPEMNLEFPSPWHQRLLNLCAQRSP